MDAGDVTFAPLTEDHLALLETSPWTSGLTTKHRDRFERQQRGDALYLVAWHRGRLIGHLLLKWVDPQSSPLAAQPTDCAEIEDFVVQPESRSCGIGARMLAAAEKRAWQHGQRHVGLGVTLDNSRARALYERVGYRDSGFGVYTIRWQYLGGDGQRHWEEARCTYLVKALTPPEYDQA